MQTGKLMKPFCSELRLNLIGYTLDLRGEVCPFTFVKTKLALEEVEPGNILTVILNTGPPLENVVRSIKDEGHKIVKVERINDSFKVQIRKG
jgi:tRNA 2-thiouridine synthesizing protein A